MNSWNDVDTRNCKSSIILIDAQGNDASESVNIGLMNGIGETRCRYKPSLVVIPLIMTDTSTQASTDWIAIPNIDEQIALLFTP